MKHAMLGLVLAVGMALGLGTASAAGVGKPFPFGYSAYDGSKVDIKDYKGKVVAILFWASYSHPSKEAVKTMIKLKEKYGSKGFEVLGVSLDTSEDQFKAFTNGYNMNWPEYFDANGPNNQLAVELKVKEMPSIFLVRKDGTLVGVTHDPSAVEAEVVKELGAK